MRTELWLTEGAELSALCRDPAELLNALSKAGVRVSEVKDCGEGRCRFSVSAADAQRAIRLGSACGAEVTVLRRRGSRHFLRRFRRRFYLWLVPLLLLLPFLWLSTLLWQIEVTGNESLSTSEILAALEKSGVYPGVSGLRLDNTRIRNRMQTLLPDLIWCTVQVRGSRARVVVRERRRAPEIVDESREREVAAGKAGTVESVQVLQGKAVVRRGDTVLPGELLITGLLSDRQAELRRVHAQGRVFARTWYEKTLELPLSEWDKLPTGEKSVKLGLRIGDLTLKFYRDGSISMDSYDRISSERQVSLLGFALPLFLLREEARETVLQERKIPVREGEELLRERLLHWLREAAPKAELLEADFRTEATETGIRVTMLAACREDIALERPLSS